MASRPSYAGGGPSKIATDAMCMELLSSSMCRNDASWGLIRCMTVLLATTGAGSGAGASGGPANRANRDVSHPYPIASDFATPRPGTGHTVAVSEYEYRPLTFPRGTDRVTAQNTLVIHAEF